MRGLGPSDRRPATNQPFSNFLLDGIEGNNYLLSGPSFAIAPEAVDEYRVSMGNYSAEFGFSSGYIANAITRSGTNPWHGTAWMNLKNETLDANDFQNNRQGLRRPALREFEPWIPDRRPASTGSGYFISSSFDYSCVSRDHSQCDNDQSADLVTSRGYRRGQRGAKAASRIPAASHPKQRQFWWLPTLWRHPSR